MSAPMLNQRIRLQAPETRRLPSGQQVPGYGPAVPVFARIDYLSSRAYTAALAEQSGCGVRLTVRRRPVGMGWRCTLPDGGVYRVKTRPEPHRVNGFLVLMLEVDDGNG